MRHNVKEITKDIITMLKSDYSGSSYSSSLHYISVKCCAPETSYRYKRSQIKAGFEFLSKFIKVEIEKRNHRRGRVCIEINQEEMRLLNKETERIISEIDAFKVKRVSKSEVVTICPIDTGVVIVRQGGKYGLQDTTTGNFIAPANNTLVELLRKTEKVRVLHSLT